MLGLRNHAFICAAFFAALVGIAIGGNVLQATGVIHDIGAFKLPFMIMIFALFLGFGFSAIPVMVMVVLGFQRTAGNANVPAVAAALRAEKWIVYAIWALMAAGVLVALPAAIKGGLFDPSDTSVGASTGASHP